MPQAERTANIIKLLKWLKGKKGANRNQIIRQIKVEITSMGSATRTAVKYLEDCGDFGLIQEFRDAPHFRISDKGKEWLERHSQ